LSHEEPVTEVDGVEFLMNCMCALPSLNERLLATYCTVLQACPSDGSSKESKELHNNYWLHIALSCKPAPQMAAAKKAKSCTTRAATNAIPSPIEIF